MSILVPDPNVRPIHNLEDAIGFIRSVSQLPEDEIRSRLKHEDLETGYNVHLDMRKWGFEPYVWSDRLVEFYQRSQAFLFESLIFNRSAAKQNLRKKSPSF